jgi:sec-independent protein translocase protein TatA
MGDGIFAPWHIIIVAVVLVLLFGSKRLPDAARSLGKSMRIMKTEIKGLHDDEPEAAKPDATTTTPELPASATPTDSPKNTVNAGDQTPAP